jgi:transposase
MQYEIRYRERALSHVESGLSQREVAKRFGISRNTLADWISRKNSGEGLAPRKRANRHKKIAPDKLDGFLRKTPDAYGGEIAAAFGCSRSAVCYALRRQGYTLKKKRPPSGSATNSNARPFAKPSPASSRGRLRMWMRQG